MHDRDVLEQVQLRVLMLVDYADQLETVLSNVVDQKTKEQSLELAGRVRDVFFEAHSMLASAILKADALYAYPIALQRELYGAWRGVELKYEKEGLICKNEDYRLRDWERELESNDIPRSFTLISWYEKKWNGKIDR